MGRYQNGNGYQEDLPERGPGVISLIFSKKKWTGGTWMQFFWWHRIAYRCANDHCCTKLATRLMMCQFADDFFHSFSLQWSHWSTGAMSRSQELCSVLDSPSSSPCRCSRSSASSHICHSWLSVEPSRSEFTRPSCQQSRRHPRDTHSSEFRSDPGWSLRFHSPNRSQGSFGLWLDFVTWKGSEHRWSCCHPCQRLHRRVASSLPRRGPRWFTQIRSALVVLDLHRCYLQRNDRRHFV